MILIIAVNSNGTHSWVGFFHDRDWDNQTYKDEVFGAIEKTFRKLRIKNRHPITITEISNVEPRTGQTKQIGKAEGHALQRSRQGGLGKREALIQAVTNAYRSRN